MSWTVDGAFAEFDRRLNLDPRERLKAEALHNQVRQAMEATSLVADSFLQGSFARKTMLKPLKDIDIVLLLDRRWREQLNGPDGPATAMEWFKQPVLRRWPGALFDQGEKPAGKALRVTLPDCPFTLDLVPAFEEEPASEHVLVGDRHDRCWERSNSRVQRRKVSERNKATSGRFVHQVRMAKAFRKHHEFELEFVSGIVMESLAYAVINTEQADKVAVARILRCAANAVLGPVLDPAGDDDVTAKWSDTQRHVAAGVFARAAAAAEEALTYEATDPQTVIDAWHTLFGDDFPPAAPRPLAKAAAAWAAGSISRAGRPSTARAGQQQAGPGRSWSSI